MTNTRKKLTRPFLFLFEKLGGGLLVALGFVITLATVFAFQTLSTSPSTAGFQSGDTPLLSDGNAGNGAFDQSTDSLEAIRDKIDLLPWDKNGTDVSYTDGNVGVGTTNPQGALDINGDVYLNNILGSDDHDTGIFLSYTQEIDHMEYTSDALAQAAYVSDATYDTYTKLLLHCDGTDASTTFTDKSSSSHIATVVGDTQIDTAQSKFRGSSCFFDGTGDALYYSSNEDFNIGTGDFTIDTWYRPTSKANTYPRIWQLGSGWYGETMTLLDRYNSNPTVFSVATVSDNPLLIGTTTVQNDIWYHIAVVRSGPTLTLYVNGVAEASATYTSSINSDNKDFNIGRANNSGDDYLNGHIDEIRISKGIARHTTNFTVPTMEYLSNYLQPYSEPIIKQQGSYSLKGVAAATDSLNHTLTRTVSPTIDLSDIDTIKFDAYASRTGSQLKISIHDSGETTTEHTINIASANTWQTVEWDISAVSNANKDVIDNIIITILNADAENTFYIDNFSTPDSISVADTLIFQTGNSEKIRVDSSGNVGIGTTSPSSRLSVWGDGSNNIFEAVDNTSSTKMVITHDGNVGIGTTNPGYRLTVNGQPAANGYTAFTNYSDRRLKENIVPLSDGILAKVLQIQPKTFNYNSKTNFDQETLSRELTGLIAQELVEIFPDMVGETEIEGEKYFDTDLTNLQIYLVKAIQELTAEKDAEIAELREVVCLDHSTAEFCK